MCTHSCLLYSFSFWGSSTAAQFLPTRGSLLGATRTTRTSRRFVSQSTSLWRPAQLRRVLSYLYFASAISDIFVINVINKFHIRFVMSFYVIYAVIYCSFCCIYVLQGCYVIYGTYMIARFMSFYKQGVTRLEMKPERNKFKVQAH